MYIRIPRVNVPDIYDDNYKFDINKAVVLKTGTDVTLISNGDSLAEANKAVELLAQKNISAEYISVPVVKPLDSKTILESASKTRFVVILENHSINGGLGSAVCELLAENLPTKTIRIGINDEFGQSGSPQELIKHYGLDAESVVNRIINTK